MALSPTPIAPATGTPSAHPIIPPLEQPQTQTVPLPVKPSTKAPPPFTSLTIDHNTSCFLKEYKDLLEDFFYRWSDPSFAEPESESKQGPMQPQDNVVEV